MSQKLKTLALWVILLLLFAGIYQVLHTDKSASRDAALPSRTAAAFFEDVAAGNVIVARPSGDALVVATRGGRSYRTALTMNDELEARLDAAGVAHVERVEPESSGQSETWLAILLVVVVVLVLIVVVLRRVRKNASTDLLGLKKTTARLVGEKPTTRFGDVGGAQNAKEQLTDIVDFLKHPERWQSAGARLPRGVLLEGPPGCGKTLLARALAGEADAAFFEVSATEFVELFVGVGAARVRDLFEEATKKAPAILFIDELDAVGRRRGAGAAGLAHQEREHTLNQLLVSMDGFGKKAQIVVVAATNRGDILDPALLRPGRFDVRIRFAPLSVDERREILTIHTRNKNLEPGIDLQKLAEMTAGFNGSELEHTANHAALAATRRARRMNQASAHLELRDFMAAIDERVAQETRFDKLDAVLIESVSQLAQPTGRVVVRAVMSEGSQVEGDIVWVDSAFAKIRRKDGTDVLVSKQHIGHMEALSGTEQAHKADVVLDAWASRQPDAG